MHLWGSACCRSTDPHARDGTRGVAVGAAPHALPPLQPGRAAEASTLESAQ